MNLLRCARILLDPEWVRSEASRLTDCFRHNEHVVRVIWFGSGAKNAMSDQSDFDFLVVVSADDKVRVAQTVYRQTKPETTFPIDLVWVSEKRFQEMKEVGGVCLIAAQDGVLLFDRGKK